MPKVKMQKGGTRIDQGEYKALILGMTEGSHPDYGDNYLWEVKVKEPTFEDEELTGDITLNFFTSQKLTSSSKNKLTQLVKAALRVDEIPIGSEVDLDSDIVGKPLRIVVKDKPSKDGGEIYSQVSDFLPLKKKKKKEEETSEDEEKPKEKAKEEKSEKSDDSDDDLFNFSD